MVVGGEVIAVSNKDLKAKVLFPRNEPFLSKLSGTVTAIPGKQLVDTNQSLISEIKRGEAIKVDEYWYRISSSVGTGAQNQRSIPPLSVSSDKEMSDRNVYSEIFTDKQLPLDGEFDSEKQYIGNLTNCIL